MTPLANKFRSVAREPRGGSEAAPGDGWEVAADVERVSPRRRREASGREEGADEDEEQRVLERRARGRHGESNQLASSIWKALLEPLW
jgi:hypothetical protein